MCVFNVFMANLEREMPQSMDFHSHIKTREHFNELNIETLTHTVMRVCKQRDEQRSFVGIASVLPALYNRFKYVVYNTSTVAIRFKYFIWFGSACL